MFNWCSICANRAKKLPGDRAIRKADAGYLRLPHENVTIESIIRRENRNQQKAIITEALTLFAHIFPRSGSQQQMHAKYGAYLCVMPNL